MKTLEELKQETQELQAAIDRALEDAQIMRSPHSVGDDKLLLRLLEVHGDRRYS